MIPIRLFEFIIEYKEGHDGNSPTYREMCDGIGIVSTNTIFIYIQKMEKAGLIEMIDRKMCLTDGFWQFNPEADKGESLYVESHTTTADR